MRSSLEMQMPLCFRSVSNVKTTQCRLWLSQVNLEEWESAASRCSQGCPLESLEEEGCPRAMLGLWYQSEKPWGQDEKSSLKSRRWADGQDRLSSQKGRTRKVLKKQRGGNGMIGEWGERPASERILGTLSSHVWLGRHSALGAWC